MNFSFCDFSSILTSYFVKMSVFYLLLLYLGTFSAKIVLEKSNNIHDNSTEETLFSQRSRTSSSNFENDLHINRTRGLESELLSEILQKQDIHIKSRSPKLLSERRRNKQHHYGYESPRPTFPYFSIGSFLLPAIPTLIGKLVFFLFLYFLNILF